MNTKCFATFGWAVFLVTIHTAAGMAAEPVRKVPYAVLTGTVESVERGLIHVQTAKYGKLSVVVTDKTEMTVLGEFGLDLIQPGMYLNFSGNMAAGEVEGEVTKATMYSPLADGFKPGIVKISDDAPVTIMGKVEKVEDQKITINAGRKVTATFSKDVVVNLNTKDYSLASPENAITFRCSIDGTTAKATHVVITVASRAKSPPAAKKP